MLMTSYYVGPEAEDRESLFLMTTELKNETDLTHLSTFIHAVFLFLLIWLKYSSTVDIVVYGFSRSARDGLGNGDARRTLDVSSSDHPTSTLL